MKRTKQQQQPKEAEEDKMYEKKSVNFNLLS